MFAILRPKLVPPRLSSITLFESPTSSSIRHIWEESNGEIMAYDYETDGKLPHEGGKVVGVGFSDSRGSFYVNLTRSPWLLATIFNKLAERQIPLIAHNLFFEMMWTEPLLKPNNEINYHGCTYAAYKHLASEGFQGQEWGLKSAQKNLLLWEETNETELDAWLVANGYIASYSNTPKPGLVPWQGKWAAPRKSEMGRAPVDILGHYCALDADATYLIWSHIFKPELERFQALNTWMTEVYPEYTKVMVEQYHRGVLIDTVFLDELWRELESKSLSYEGDLRREFAPQLAIFNQAVADERLAKEPPRYTKAAAPKPEPKKHTARKEVSSRWLDWSHSILAKPKESKNWQNWFANWVTDLTTDHFNFGSGPQREWLFYEALGLPVKVRTESGLPATGEEALLGFGTNGKTLLNLMGNEKALSSITSLREQLVFSGNIYHPQVKMPGANTGRLSGSNGYNWQNPPKSKYMQAFAARPGFVIVSCDIVALEAVALAERSRDPTLMKLYGPGSIPGTDIYLFNGSQLPIIGPKIRAAGFDPDAMTKEGTARAKKEAKKERDIAKVITLSSNYGAGPGKIHETLTLAGVDISFEECQAIHGGFWELYGGIKVWERKLKSQWQSNGGWFLNGIGRPICVDKEYIKDIVNRDTQSTGHDIFVMFLLTTTSLLHHRFEMYPWSADVHDAWYFEVREEEAVDFCEAVRAEVLPAWNATLGGTIALRAEPAIVTNLWLDKSEGKDFEEAKIYAEIQRQRLAEPKV